MDRMSTGPQMLKIVHHHIFKCAGSSFAWILQKNFPNQVLFIEGIRADYRIRCEDVVHFLADNEKAAFQAVSSHLLATPTPKNEIARLHVSFLRDPWKRIVSEYNFMVRNRHFNGVIDEYIKRLLNPRSTKTNF